MEEISISGSDGVGKTEQINLLGYSHNDQLHFTGQLGSYNDRWPKVDPVSEFNWWFKEVPFPEFNSLMIDSLNARHRACKTDKINIHDRGVNMFKAVCAATLITREQIDIQKAVALIEEIFRDQLEFVPTEHDLLLIPNQEYRNRIKPFSRMVENRASSYLPWQNSMYDEYQIHLKNATGYFFHNIGSERVVEVDACILDMQNRIRTLISTISPSQIHHLCQNLERLVAFGGLSECGKSSFAQKLSLSHGYYRLKLKYFDEIAKLRCLKPSQKNVGREILTFLQSHTHITNASLESLHGVVLPACLKLLFGNRISIIYIDTAHELRVLRTANELGVSRNKAEDLVTTKDEAKISFGADKVKDISDFVVNNNGDFEKSFDLFVQNL